MCNLRPLSAMPRACTIRLSRCVRVLPGGTYRLEAQQQLDHACLPIGTGQEEQAATLLVLHLPYATMTVLSGDCLLLDDL